MTTRGPRAPLVASIHEALSGIGWLYERHRGFDGYRAGPCVVWVRKDSVSMCRLEQWGYVTVNLYSRDGEEVARRAEQLRKGIIDA